MNLPDIVCCSSRSAMLRRLFAVLLALNMAGASTLLADDIDLASADDLVRAGKYAEAYELLLPFAEQNADIVDFNLLLGESALRTNRADAALLYFRRSLNAAPDSIDAHLGLAQAYLALGNYASAKIEFESVLRIDDLPPDLHQQVEIYRDAALAYASGDRFLPSGYLVSGVGNYRVNATSGTNEFGGSDTDDNFLSLRGGAGFNYFLNDDYALNGSLDYRYRNYNNDDRRDDKDLRWNGAVNRSIGENNLLVGLRGRSSYRGNSDWRNDYGIYGDWRRVLGPDDQLNVGLELRRRQYPRGQLRERSRDIAESTLGWTHALLDGKASFNLVASGGREFSTNDRPDGDSSFYGLSPTLNFTLSETLGGFVFGWWQRQRYNIERLNVDGADNILGILEREDDLYELGGGLTWQFAPAWSLNPEILYIRDDSNILAQNYSSTETWITLRRDF